METLLIALLSGIGVIVAYHTYGRWLGSKIFRLTADAVCPSKRLEDGVDYVPTSKSVVVGHQPPGAVPPMSAQCAMTEVNPTSSPSKNTGT